MALCFISGTAAFIITPRYDDSVSEEDLIELKKCSPVLSIKQFFVKKNIKKIAFISVVSIIIGVLCWLSLYNSNSVIYTVRYVSVALMLIFSTVIDYKTHKIPNWLVLSFFIEGTVLLVVEIILNSDDFLAVIVRCAAGLLFCLVLFYILSRLTKDGIGMGDIKLISVIGWIIGLSSALISILFSLICCSVVTAFLLATKRKKKTDSIPFSPFILAGYLAMFLVFCL